MLGRVNINRDNKIYIFKNGKWNPKFQYTQNGDVSIVNNMLKIRAGSIKFDRPFNANIFFELYLTNYNSSYYDGSMAVGIENLDSSDKNLSTLLQIASSTAQINKLNVLGSSLNDSNIKKTYLWTGGGQTAFVKRIWLERAGG